MSATDDECMQFYEQEQLMMDVMGMDASISSGGMLSPSNSQTSGHQLTPNIKSCAFKPIRRRSRASKRTPIILLKANTSNFRAIVQQFTGCPATTTMSLKGPINLNFQQAHQHQPPFGSSSNQVSLPPPKHQLLMQEPPTWGRPLDDGFLFDGFFM
ncbi:hypothetical protein VNO78_11010 [Psophocarpus tetragonolobus]|uniref:VQ domain-containing protein n=1 Tax=Psophocarpus tetragonolobus TaxID=3891 RepID=A0AAN9XNI3_PSOTE